MKKKSIYLLILLIITLLGVVLSPTYAKFTSGFITEEDIVGMTLSFNLGISNIEEYEEIVLEAGDYEIFNVEIANATSSDVYYGIWYKMVMPLEKGGDIKIAKLEGTDINTSGSIVGNETKTVSIIIINWSNNNIKINVGVGSSNTSISDIEYLGGKYLISGTSKIPYLSDHIVDLYNDSSSLTTVNIGGNSTNPTVSQNSNQSIMLDNNGEYRYYGASPNNYVEFNNEVWRIISVSNVMSDEDDSSGSMKVKIIGDYVGSYSWDSSDSSINNGWGVNDWSQADLMKELNTFYYDSTSGECYSSYNNSLEMCDFSNNGINLKSKNLISESLWYLGGQYEENDLYADDYYNFERGNTVWGTSDGQTCNDGVCPRSTKWVGNVGLIYPSDYMYAVDLNLCKVPGRSDNQNDYRINECINNNWLYHSLGYLWTISPNSGTTSSSFIINSSGCVTYSHAHYTFGFRPVVYLRTDVIITGGNGTSANPYKLGVKKDYLTSHVVNLYNDGSKLTAVNIGGDSINPIVTQNTKQSIMLDNNGEYRYYGKEPNNYVEFNNELWKIISVSNVKDDENDKVGSSRVKLVRIDAIGTYSFDSSTASIYYGWGVNDWSKSDLMSELNTLYYNKTSGNCFTSYENSVSSCDFSNSGLKDDSKKLIKNALWYLGGKYEEAGLYADDYYNFERGTTVYQCSIDDGACPRVTSWSGKIGLMYPSDYAYATDLSICKVFGYDNEQNDYRIDSCKNNNWLYDSLGVTRLITPNSGTTSSTFVLNNSGHITYSHAHYAFAIRPTLYLKSNVILNNGDGSRLNPYQIIYY